MKAAKIPPGLWECIWERDRACLNCGEAEKTDLTLAHLIGRGRAPGKDLRWAERNLAMLCERCHGNCTEEVSGYTQWNVTGFGDKEASLRAFWVAFHSGMVSKTKPHGGWVDPQVESDACDLVKTPQDALDPLTIQTRFKAALRDTREGFLESARLADQIQDGELWIAMGCETLAEMIADPEVGLERSRFFRLAQLGRLLRLSDASNLPVLPERRWIKILTRVKGLKDGRVDNPEEIQDLIEKAKVLTGSDFEIALHEGKNATEYPEVAVKIPQDALVYQGDKIIGKLQFVKVGDTHHIVCMAIPHEFACVPLTLTLR